MRHTFGFDGRDVIFIKRDYKQVCKNLTLLLFAVYIHVVYLFSDDDIQINIGMNEMTVLISSYCTFNPHQAVLLMKEEDNYQLMDLK